MLFSAVELTGDTPRPARVTLLEVDPWFPGSVRDTDSVTAPVYCDHTTDRIGRDRGARDPHAVLSIPKESLYTARLIDALIAVIVNPIAALFWFWSTDTASVPDPLIDSPITVIVSLITELFGHCTALPAEVEEPLIALPIAVIISAVAELFWERTTLTTSVSDPLIDLPITVVVEPITALWLVAVSGWRGGRGRR